MERLESSMDRIARAILPAAEIRRWQRVDVGLDNQGYPRLEGRRFIPVLSPDGTEWRIRVGNDGTITAKRVEPT